MKDWDYYKNVGVDYPDLFARRGMMVREINEASMSANERREALKAVPQKVREQAKPELDAYAAAVAAKTAEFWHDCRADLGYSSWIRSSKAIAAIEAYAWQRGHANGYSEVYGCLSELVDLLQIVVSEES